MATTLAIQPDEKDPRLLMFQGRKKLFNGGQNPLMYLSDLRQEKWVRTRKAKVSSRPNQQSGDGDNLTDAQLKAIQKG